MMTILFDDTGDIARFAELANELSADPRVAGLFVLTCDANGWTPEAVNPVLKSIPKALFGGVFPQIIYQSRNYHRGTVVVGLPTQPQTACIAGLSDRNADFAEALAPWADRWDQQDPAGGTLIVIVDGLGSRIAALVAALFEVFGLERNFLGGGAGSLSFQQRPCLITADGLVADAALVVYLPLASGVGVAHGWTPIGEPMEVTHSDGNVIKSLDWQPAFAVYQQHVEPHAGRRFSDADFFDIAKGYPFGISRLGGELVVRDPLRITADQGLVCVGEVPQGCYVHLLHGMPERLIAAGRQARELALAALQTAARPADAHAVSALFFDCISRALFLGPQIDEELAAASGGLPLTGAFTLGEIANSGREFLEFYNKTAVFGVLAMDELAKMESEILFELALKAGGSLDLTTTLREFVTTLLRLIGGRGAQVLAATADARQGYLDWQSVFALPRPLAKSNALAEFLGTLALPDQSAQWSQWAAQLPLLGASQGRASLLFDLPGFGLLFLQTAQDATHHHTGPIAATTTRIEHQEQCQPLSPAFLHSLQKILNLLATACLARISHE